MVRGTNVKVTAPNRWPNAFVQVQLHKTQIAKGTKLSEATAHPHAVPITAAYTTMPWLSLNTPVTAAIIATMANDDGKNAEHDTNIPEEAQDSMKNTLAICFPNDEHMLLYIIHSNTPVTIARTSLTE